MLAIATCACADIPPLSEDVCGNGVVELGEDCDIYPAHDGAGLRCGTDDTAACRYVCDAATMIPPCPEGWTCGGDGICSYASGEYAGATPPVTFEADDWEIHDVNGDGVVDLTSYGEDRVRVRFADGQGEFPEEFERGTPTIVGRVEFTDLDGDGADDAIVPLEPHIHLMRGAADRLEPVAALTEDRNDWPDDSWLLLQRMDWEYFPANNVFALYASETGIVERNVSGPDVIAEAVVAPGPYTIEQMIKPVALGNIDADPLDRTQELIVTFPGDDQVFISGQVPPASLPPVIAIRAQVTLPGMAIDKGAAIADVDGDGNPDLLVSVDDDRVAVAAGDGVGGFGAPAIDDRFDDLLEIYDPGDSLDGVYTEFQRWPLATVDLNGDGRTDYVSPNGIYVTDPTTERLRQAQWRINMVSEWTHVAVGDFDGNGVADVAAIAALATDDRGIDVFQGRRNDQATNVLIPTAEPPRFIVKGDFDADYIDDLAVVLVDRLGGPDSIWVLYGNHSDGLSAPMCVGTYNYIFAIGAGQLWSPSPIPGPADSLAFRGTPNPDGTGVVRSAPIWGSPLRQMASTYLLRDAEGPGGGDRIQTAVAGRFAPSQQERDIVMLTDTGRFSLDAPRERVWLQPGAEGVEVHGLSSYDDVQGMFGDDTCSVEGVLMRATDLDGDGFDEVVTIDQSDECPQAGLAGTPRPSLSIIRIDEPSFAVENLGSPGELLAPYQLELADMDRDGDDDLVVTYAGEYLADTPGLARGSGAAVYWNDAGTIDLASSSILLIPAGVQHVVSAVPIAADGDPELELAVLTDTGVFICDPDEPRGFTSPCRPIEGTPGLRRTKSGAERLRVADVNGDGLHDLLIGRRGSIAVHLARRHF